MELTKAEEQILHYLWKLEEATVQDILSCMDDAGKPSRTTVSTIKPKRRVLPQTAFWLYQPLF